MLTDQPFDLPDLTIMVRAAIRERNWIEPKLGHAARISDVDMCRLDAFVGEEQEVEPIDPQDYRHV